MSTDAWGITNGYEDAEEAWHDTPVDTHAAILSAMGVADPQARLLDENAVRVVPYGVETAWLAGRIDAGRRHHAQDRPPIAPRFAVRLSRFPAVR